MTDSASPRVSILIPNFNNGRASSRSGRDDLIGDLLQSLWDTLKDDPTPFEIIAYDDGSSDDSLQTLRNWAGRAWPAPRSVPFLRLIEAEHCGVLSCTANILSRQATGQILARLDGDVVCLTPHWVTKLCQVFDQGPAHLGMVGPKQLTPHMRIHAYGDFVLHPNGYHHVANDMPRDAVKYPLEVDHVMGCFYCCRKQVFDDLDGYDENILRGQTVDFGLRARLKGWTCLAVPHIEFVHAHMLRLDRPNLADSDAGREQTLRVFYEKWGFDRIAPDLDVVRRRYAGTPLLWNKHVFCDETIFPPDEPIAVETCDWVRYTRDEQFRQSVNMRLTAAGDFISQTKVPDRLVLLGAGHGLLTHLLAKQGIDCIGFDHRRPCVELAGTFTVRQTYPAAGPRYEHLEDPRHIDVGDGQAEMVVIDSYLERHPNPVALLAQAWRILAPDHLLLVISRRKAVAGHDPSQPGQMAQLTADRRYQWLELLGQISAVGGWKLMVDITSDDRSRDLVVAAQRVDKADDTTSSPDPRAVNAA